MRHIKHGSDYHTLNDDGTIDQWGQSWKVKGAIEYNNFGNEVRRYPLSAILQSPESIPWLWKNGKQRVHIMDLDHGTTRVWMSPRHYIW